MFLFLFKKKETTINESLGVLVRTGLYLIYVTEAHLELAEAKKRVLLERYLSNAQNFKNYQTIKTLEEQVMN